MFDPSAYLVHLVWAPLGPAPFARFMASYRQRLAGADHRLVVVMKGFGSAVDRRPWLDCLDGVTHDEVEVESDELDLGTYRRMADLLPGAKWYCFTNSSSTVMVSGWLGYIEHHLANPDVGLVGTAGSFESAYSAAPIRLGGLIRRGFEPFPNPHIRTNGFALSRELMLSMDWPPTRRKVDALRLESGRQSITRQVLGRGLRVLVVGADGVGYPPERWYESATFRSGGQRNLLIADNRTRQYDEADTALKSRLEQMAWGPV